MRGCGCDFTPVNKETEEIKYTDALAEQFAALESRIRPKTK